MRVFLGTLFFTLLFAGSAKAAVCESGVLKDAAGGTPTGTCTLTQGASGTNVTCFNGQLQTADSSSAGTCSLAQQPTGDLQRDGVFGCSSSKYANVGSTVAIAGVYVPVNDAAVTLNTGYLVYKECVLDGVISKISEAARTDLTQTTLRKLNEGRNGNPMWVRRDLKERVIDPQDRAVKVGISEKNTAPMCDAFETKIVRNYVRGYVENKKSAASFACSFPAEAGDLQKAQKGEVSEDNVLSAIGWLAVPGNNELTAALLFNEDMNDRQNTAVYLQDKKIVDGFYGVTDGNEDPFEEKTLTPAFLVSKGAEQVYTSGFRCIEGADELSEICAPLFSAIVPESFNNGLYSMTRSQSGLPSFVSRMVSEAAAAVRSEAVNAALSILLTTRQFELAFKDARDTAATALTNAINKLRSTENKCWELIVNNPSGPRVCASPPDANRRCTTPETCTTNTDGSQQCAPGIQLTVSTSSQYNFAQPIIDAQIAPVALRVAGDIKASVATLQELDKLIGDVSNAASAANQRAALSRLDQLVAPNARLPDCSPEKTLHSAGDVQCANKERDDIGTAVGYLVENTVRDWGDSQDPNVGWCNVNNPAVIQRWINAWK